MGWNFEDGKPIHLQLVEEITHRIITGKYAPGSRIPSVRELAAEAAVNPNTMQRALATLETGGLIYSERTSGRFVTNELSLIDQSKKELAKASVVKFFSAMEDLGFGKDEAIAMASELKEVK